MSKTYLPQLAKELNEVGNYIFAHKVAVYAALQDDDRLTDEQKTDAKKVLDMVLQHHDIFRTLHVVRSPRDIADEMRRKGLR
ncbi:MAG: hypothetical protein H0X30_03650 [Anaerolineae bacterium]|nr:hypothetical protein [Anaerolineae bacterium]